MSFRPVLFVPALLAMALSLAQTRTVLAADGAVTKPEPPPIQVTVAPPCVQSYGLIHVSITPASPEYRQKMMGSAEYRAAFFDIFYGELRFRPAFFDVFVADDLRTRPAFFDVFVELDLPPGATPVAPRKLALVCGFLTPTSVELLMQTPRCESRRTRSGIVMVMDDRRVMASTPVMLFDPLTPRQHVLASCQGIASFFDVFTEITIDEPGVHLTARQRALLAHEATHVLQNGRRAELNALQMISTDVKEIRRAATLLHVVLADLDGDTRPD